MAFDVAGDVAVTMFARRSVGCVLADTHVLSRGEGRWHLLGGGSSGADPDLLALRPAQLPDYLAASPHSLLEIDPRLMALDGGGGVHDNRGRPSRWPWSGRWISYMVLRVAADVATLATGERELLVPWHGRVVVASVRRGAPVVTAYDSQGHVLGTVSPRLRSG